MKPGYKQTDVGVIPEEWEVVALASLATTVASGRSQSGLLQGTYPVYGSTGIIGYTERPEYEGDSILAARVGANAGKLNLVSGKYGVTDNTIILRLSSGCSLPFFWRQLKTKRLNSLVFGSGQPLITGSQLKALSLSAPPLPEQRAIAEALSDVDALLGGLDRLIAKKRDLKQAAMQQLLTGETRLPGFHGEWEVKRFGEVAFPRRERVDPRRTGVHDFCIELEHIASASGELLGSTSTGDQSSLKSVFRSGDVLFGKLRAYLRKYWLATRSGVCSTEVWVFTPKDRLVTTEFLFQLIKTEKFIEAASNSYGTHMPRSDWNIVKNYELALPPLPEQTAIAVVLGEMDAELAGLEQRREKTSDLKQGMMQELLTGRIRLV